MYNEAAGRKDLIEKEIRLMGLIENLAQTFSGRRNLYFNFDQGREKHNRGGISRIIRFQIDDLQRRICGVIFIFS